MEKDSTLVSLNPPSTLVFQLERGTEPRSNLKVTNISNSNVVFKVKTTQPSWYYVRPNQQLLAPGQSEDVKVLLVGSECNRFLDQAAVNAEEKLDKHRFLVQSKVVDDNEYSRVMALPVAQRGDEFSKLWETNKDDRRNVKLKVDFKYPAAGTATGAAAGGGGATTRAAASGGGNGSSNAPIPSVSENVENVRSRLGAAGGADDRGSSNSSSGSSSSNSTFAASSPEAMFTELQSIRKKYDAVVEYTVHLTAERDAIVAQLEVAQRELSKEKSKKKGSGGAAAADGATGQGAGKKGDKSGDRKIIEKGFSLFVVLFTALICFLIGKYLS